MPDGTLMLLLIIFIGVCVRSNMFVSSQVLSMMPKFRIFIFKLKF